MHTPFSIYHFVADEWVHSVHKHTYFEIIFILKGNGTHHINGNAFPYDKGDVFLLGPEDFHHFDILRQTEFSFVRFNESQHRQIEGNQDRPWRPVIHTLLHTSSQSRGSIVEDQKEKEKLHQLLMVLEAEGENERSQYYEIVKDSILRTMLVILARNLFTQGSPVAIPKESIDRILMYIKQHIFYPEKLSIKHLASLFNYSPAYISLFFKRQTGESLKLYITKFKINLIESRLTHSKLTLTDIAYEFNYADESHLCKQFRKYTGITPTAFRKKNNTQHPCH